MGESEKKGRKITRSPMSGMDCKDNVRFTLSDDTGVLKFKTFDIVNTPACARLAKQLREYLLARPLREIDMQVVKAMRCPHHNGVCLDVVARVIEEHVEFFG
jgi:hypothetical protein